MKMSATFDASLRILLQRKVINEVRHDSLPSQIMHIGGHGSLAGINVMVVSCCDGHQFMDITQHTFKCCGAAKDAFQKELGLSDLGEDCFHWRTENGGPFVLSVPELSERTYTDPSGKKHPVRVDHDMLACLQESMSLKKLNVVLLIGHSVCGKMAPLVGTYQGYVSYMAAAKARIMNELNLPKAQVISWLQSHRTNGKRRTYHVDYSEAVALPVAA